MAQIGSSSNGTQVTIPDLTAPANIQDAFKLYHLGDLNLANDTTSPSENSIAGHLKSIRSQVNNIQSVTSSEISNDSQDLNDLTATGNYYRLISPVPTGKNYPTLTNTTLSYPGYLTVINASGDNKPTFIFQTYTMTNIPADSDITGQKTAYFWRSKVNNAEWSPWYQAASQKSIAELTAGKQSTLVSSSANANKVIVADGNGQISTTGSIANVTKTEVETLAGINATESTAIVTRLAGKASISLGNVSMDPTQATTMRTKLGTILYTATANTNGSSIGNKIFVQPTQPTSGMVAGDLWFY